MIQAKIIQFMVKEDSTFLFWGWNIQETTILQGLLKKWFWIVLSA